ncbi:ABC transporter substrate-binding protein [Niveispirillum sp.]|uniref:substrate-binding periplasmic protein n=1 Tax=Niveispirillum sp. TaxID=1917217 RepID=UPI001B6EF4A4|nr:transporter substrate-binding domain-containing protein [Niveispirillum sp.]MBP7336400.1 transporter substrate-binding domain-containing protein [Niveispirillum sp.]
MRGLSGRLATGLTATALCLVAPTLALAEGRKGEPTLFLVTEPNPPVNFLDPLNGQLIGLATDKVRLIMQDAGISHDISIMPWPDAVAAVDQRPDACIFLMNLTDERRPNYQWVAPLMEGGWALFAPLGFQRRISGPADLTGLRIAVQAGGALEKHLREITRDVPNVTLVTAEGAAEIGNIFNGRADLYAGGAWAAPYQARQVDMPVRMVMRLTRSTGALACNKKVPAAMVTRMQKALDAIIADGRAGAVERRYSTPGSWGGWGLDRRPNP